MLNYVNNWSIWGLMNKNAFINTDSNKLSYYKTKNKKKVVFFERISEDDENNYSQINYMYLNDDPHDKRASSMEQIVSILDKHMFTDMPGKEYREIRETVNKYKNVVTVKPITSETIPVILNMIEKWRYMDNGGMKYKWQEHAGIDKAIVSRYIKNDWKDSLIGTSFWINEECIGYSLIERYASDVDNNKFEYKYLTRKVLNNWRNITEYVDWYTFNQLWKTHIVCHSDNTDMLINWGCSSGGVHWYKTHKWPVYSLDKKWFMTIKNDNN